MMFILTVLATGETLSYREGLLDSSPHGYVGSRDFNFLDALE